MKKTRILYIDLLKLLAIYLVLWGHCLMQFRQDYENSFAFQIIYAFHMPLFMMLSGYFARSSMELSLGAFFPKKFRQLLLPCLSWGIVCWLLITSGLIGGRFHLDVPSLFTGWLGLVDNFWFLKSCFICYALTWLCWRCGKYRWMVSLVVWLLCLMQGRWHLNLMFPCFLAGLWFRSDKRLEGLLMRYSFVPIMMFVALLLYKLLGQPLPVDNNLRLAMQAEGFSFVPYFQQQVFRILLGLSGAFSCFWIFKVCLGSRMVTPLLQSLSLVGGGNIRRLCLAGHRS